MNTSQPKQILRVSPYGSDGFKTDFSKAIQFIIKQHPTGCFIEIDRYGQRKSFAYTDLYQRALKILSHLSQNIPKQVIVVLYFDNAYDFIAAAWACLIGSYTFVPVQASGTTQKSAAVQQRLQWLTELLGRFTILTTSELRSNISGDKSNICENIICIELIDQNTTTEYHLENVANSGRLFQNKASLLIQTSGTGAKPKLVEIRHDNLLNRLIIMYNRDKHYKVINFFPFDAITGISFLLLPSTGQTVYFQPDRLTTHPLDLLQTINEYQIQSLRLSISLASVLNNIIKRSKKSFDLSSLKILGFGTELIEPSIIKSFIRLCCSFQANPQSIEFSYGMTETGLITGISLGTATEALQSLEENRIPSLGECYPGCSLRIIDNNENELPQGVSGHIQYRSVDYVFTGYYGNIQASNTYFTDDHWFRTGDIGFITDGTLSITGRAKDMIIINGQNHALAQIESTLCHIDGIEQIIIASSIRNKGVETDQLALFFVPKSFEKPFLDQLCRQLIYLSSKEVGISVKHLIPVKSEQIARTRTGKISREIMVRRYQSGDLENYLAIKQKHNPVPNHSSSIQTYLLKLLQDILKLDSPPEIDEDFFVLGGGSLASAELISSVEERYACQLSLKDFFSCPTIANLTYLLKKLEKTGQANSGLVTSFKGNELLHKIQTYTGSWQGSRLFKDSLIIGANTQGSKQALFWVFQSHNEFKQLAKQLGSEQPLYGMRSCVELIKVEEYTTDVLETVCDRYLQEILALPIGQPINIGGNCQGGIIALDLARRLIKIQRQPSTLILLEWSYSYGSYDNDVLLVYGKDSHTASIYRNEKPEKLDWKSDFPNHRLVSIAGKHGTFFQKRNLIELAACINSCDTSNDLFRKSLTQT